MNDLANRIVSAALPTVPFDGWTAATMEKSAASLGLTAFDLHRAFPNGIANAVALFCANADAQMVASLRSDYQLSTLKIRERIATAVMVRFRQQAPYRECVRRALAFYAVPWHAASGLKALYDTVDAIWREAGDTSTDYNFYTKRIMLAGVLQSTLSVWLEDSSADLSETEAFLRRRIENVMQIEKAKAQLRDFLRPSA